MAVCGDRPPFSNRILKVHLWEKGKNFMNKEKNIRWIPVLCFGVLMLGLGSSDSLRGIFSPVFQEHYSVGGRGLSMMGVISYVGNLLFLSVGGKMMDTFDRKKVAMGMLGIWMAAVLLNVLTDSYPMILLSMFLALGASTMLNTTVNLLTPMVCAGYAGMMVNIFFFIQGIGTSGSQFLLGRFAFSYDGWKMINGVLFAVGLVSLVLFAMVNLKPEKEKTKPKTIQKKKPQDMPGASIFWLLVLMMGFYFIEVFVLVVVAVQLLTFRCKREWITVQTVQIIFFSQHHMSFFIQNRFLRILVVLEDKIPFRFSVVRVFACDMFNYCHGNHLPFSSLHISFHKYPGETFGFHFSFLKRGFHPD